MTESLVKPNPQQENDVLMVFHVREFEEKVSAQEFLKKNSEDIAVLLTSEDKDLSDKLQGFKVGEEIDMSVLRKSENLSLKARLEERK